MKKFFKVLIEDFDTFAKLIFGITVMFLIFLLYMNQELGRELTFLGLVILLIITPINLYIYVKMNKR